MEHLTNVFPFTGQCRKLAAKTLCNYYYVPCGYNSIIHVPRFLCPDVCDYVSRQLCSKGWDVFLKISLSYKYQTLRFETPECNNTDSFIGFLNLTNDCCTSGGIIIQGIIPEYYLFF